jgi:hypothetical protein
MKRYLIARSLVVAVVLSVCGFAQQAVPAHPQKNKDAVTKVAAMQSFTGVISDGQCGGSHQEVMKRASVNSPANCVKGCARRHGFVLYDPATKKVYKLSDQERPADFADQKVKIKGTLDKGSQMIYVNSIEPAK